MVYKRESRSVGCFRIRSKIGLAPGMQKCCRKTRIIKQLFFVQPIYLGFDSRYPSKTFHHASLPFKRGHYFKKVATCPGHEMFLLRHWPFQSRVPWEGRQLKRRMTLTFQVGGLQGNTYSITSSHSSLTPSLKFIYHCRQF